MAKRKPKLDLSKPHVKIINNEPDRPELFAAYKQNGVIFDQNMQPMGEYEEPSSQKATERAKREAAVANAEDILGDLGPVVDPTREAAKENAQAAAAEALADDA